MSNIDSAENMLDKHDRNYEEKHNLKEGDWYYGSMDGQEFSLFIQDLLISENGYVLDTGNYKNVNYVCAYRLLEKIKAHPKLWKLFFMIA